MVNANQPPMYLEASSPRELRLLMLANNKRHGRRFQYFDMSFAKGKWYCWYEISETERVMNGPETESDR